MGDIMKKILILLLATMLFFSNSFICFAKENDIVKEMEDTSKSSILMCMDTGDIIYENNAYEHCSPASITKIMSILLFFEALDSKKINLDDKVSASENAVSKGGSQIWLEVGETMTVNDLLKAVIVASANDACTALGEYVAGSEQGFVKMMNDRAKQLGLENTNFENCTGLDDSTKNHYSCAYDLALIAKEVMKHDKVTKYTSIWLDSLRNGKTEINNTNKLVNKYKGLTGLKTGTTSNAGFCLCATAKRNGMNLVAVVLGCKTSAQRFSNATKLLDYGFANYEIIEPQVDLNKITNVKVINGKDKIIKPIIKKQNNKIMIKKGDNNIKYKYDIKKDISAPVKKDDVLGTISVVSNDKVIKKITLFSNNDIEKVSFLYIFTKMLHNI